MTPGALTPDTWCQVMCAEAVLGTLSESFVTWGWDLTYPSNKQRLLDMISR